MKKMLKLLLVLFALYIIFQIISGIFSKGYEIKYNLNGLKVYEKRVKNIKDEIDNYYFEITKDDITFGIQTFDKIVNFQKVLKEIKYFKNDNYECVLPITKNDKIISDIMCYKDGIYYLYNSIKSRDSELDEFANNLSNYRDSFIESNEILKSDVNVDVYDNFEDNLNIGIEFYKGLYTLNKKFGYRKTELFKKDIYTKEISGFVNENYVVADYSQEYEFHQFYVVNIRDYKKSVITSNKAISMYSYVQGTVGNSMYLIDITNKLQYEIDVKNKTVTIVGNENSGYKYYQDGKWEKGNMYDAVENKVYFEKINTNYNDKEYARVDKIGGELSGFYYIYKKDDNLYNVYKINVQNNNKIYLFSTDNITGILYDKNYIFYKDKTFIKYYSDLSGSKKLVKYDEVSFNDSLKFSFDR